MSPTCWNDALTSQANGATKSSAPGSRIAYDTAIQIRLRALRRRGFGWPAAGVCTAGRGIVAVTGRPSGRGGAGSR
jgi:hypothetical protein